MRIGFSARGLSVPSGGVREFLLSVIKSLNSRSGEDEIFIFYNDEQYCGLAADCNEIYIPGSNRLIWDFYKLPAQLRKFNIASAVYPKNVVPFFSGCRNYVVVHDLAYFHKHLNAYKFWDTFYMRIMVPSSLRRTDGIIAVSENTKNDIVGLFGVDASKIIVAHEAADEKYKPVEDGMVIAGIKSKYGLPDEFILYTGSLSPRKNIVRLLEAFSMIRDKIGHKLVLTGSKSWKDSEVYCRMKELDLEDRILKLGYVESEDMPAVYSCADLYVYPSLFEGFGLPVLEAMSCGCAVVCSNVSSIPEVAGDAALLTDPFDVECLAKNIYEVLQNAKLKDRLIKAGHEQAAKFTWDKFVDSMLGLLRK